MLFVLSQPVFTTKTLAPKPTSHGSERFSYMAYGIGIQSNIPIPEFTVAQLPPSLYIHLEPEAHIQDYLPSTVLPQKAALQVSRQSAVIYLQQTGVFLLESGQQITIIPAPETTAAQIRHALYGIVMAVILYQRGRFVLHGSAINLDGQGVAFLGHAGEGKSSMAAALNAQGYALLTDDLVAVDLNDVPPSITAAGTPTKLYPETAHFLGIKAPGEPLPTPLPKQRFVLSHSVEPGSIPLRAIYVLSSGQSLRIESMSAPAAMVVLMEHAGLRSMLPIQDPALFQASAQLAQACPLFRLQRPRDLTQFPQVIAAVQRHVRS